jgi:hypothetical protein
MRHLYITLGSALSATSAAFDTGVSTLERRTCSSHLVNRDRITTINYLSTRITVQAVWQNIKIIALSWLFDCRKTILALANNVLAQVWLRHHLMVDFPVDVNDWRELLHW